MLLGVTTAATTGEHGTGFAGAANAGTEISAQRESGDKYFHDTLLIWTVVVFGISASAGPAPAGLKMPMLVLPAHDRDHKFRTIKNDSDCPGSERNVLARGGPTPWRGLGFACFIELSLGRPTWQSRGALSVHRHPWLRAGIRTVNTEPLPGSLATVTSPPIMRASLRDRARPSPVPP
jgi:hypothetical protein